MPPLRAHVMARQLRRDPGFAAHLKDALTQSPWRYRKIMGPVPKIDKVEVGSEEANKLLEDVKAVVAAGCSVAGECLTEKAVPAAVRMPFSYKNRKYMAASGFVGLAEQMFLLDGHAKDLQKFLSDQFEPQLSRFAQVKMFQYLQEFVSVMERLEGKGASNGARNLVLGGLDPATSRPLLFINLISSKDPEEVADIVVEALPDIRLVIKGLAQISDFQNKYLIEITDAATFERGPEMNSEYAPVLRLPATMKTPSRWGVKAPKPGNLVVPAGTFIGAPDSDSRVEITEDMTLKAAQTLPEAWDTVGGRCPALMFGSIDRMTDAMFVVAARTIWADVKGLDAIRHGELPSSARPSARSFIR